MSNNGRYGVQEFTTINYDNNTKIDNAPFFSLFYNDGNLQVGNVPIKNVPRFPEITSPSLSRARATGTTKFDLSATIQLPVVTDTNKFHSGCFRINEIYLNRKDIYQNRLLITEYYKAKDSVKCPFLTFGLDVREYGGQFGGGLMNISLFGSRFYNAQTLEGKAFLFLHCFPWKGLVSAGEENSKHGLFKLAEILNTFKYRTGFVQVPKYYPAFLGGLLKRSFGEFLKFEVKNNNNNNTKFKLIIIIPILLFYFLKIVSFA
jgi:hypothetical protein